MGKSCSICGDGLRFWDRVQGRFDHPECRERSVVKLPSDNKEPELPLWKLNALFKIARTFQQIARTSR
jgi:hypothetical protein